MNSEMILVNGETCPAVMPSPMKSQDDARANPGASGVPQARGRRRGSSRCSCRASVSRTRWVNPHDMPPAPKLWHVDEPRGPRRAGVPAPGAPGPRPMGLGGSRQRARTRRGSARAHRRCSRPGVRAREGRGCRDALRARSPAGCLRVITMGSAAAARVRAGVITADMRGLRWGLPAASDDGGLPAASDGRGRTGISGPAQRGQGR